MLEERLELFVMEIEKNEQRFVITGCINVFRFMRFLCRGAEKKRLTDNGSLASS